MNFTIYSLGDLSVFRSALNAVAMLFNPANPDAGLWVSAGNSFGVGTGVYLGMLVALLVALYQAAMSGRVDLKPVLMPLMVYTLMVVPKADVQIEDVYEGKVAKVDNVPIGIAIPGSVISSIAWQVTQSFETVFSTVDGSYSSMSSDNGFVTPLKLLNSLRSAPGSVNGAFPYLTRSLQELTINCLVGREEFKENLYRQSTNPISYALTAAGSVSGLTVYYSDATPSGIAKSCADAAELIKTDADSLFKPFPSSAGIINPKGLKTIEIFMNAGIGSGKGADGKEPFRYEDYEKAYTALVHSTAEQAKNFVLLSTLEPHISAAAYCAPEAANVADLARCMPFASATEQWREDAAASGAFFSKIMVNGMNIMIFLSYVLFPMMVIAIMLLGPKGVQAAGAYAMFTISTQMWLPVAAVINYFIQLQVMNEISAFGGQDLLLNAYNAPLFYEKVSTKLALASDMIGAIPLLCMSIFTGSMFATTRIAERWGGRDYYDEKVNSPEPVKMDAVANAGGYFALEGFSSAIEARGLADIPTVDVGKGMQTLQRYSIGSTQTQADTHERQLMDSLGDEIRHGNGAEVKSVLTRALGAEKGSQVYTSLASGKGALAEVSTASDQGNSHNQSHAERDIQGTDHVDETSLDKSLRASMGLRAGLSGKVPIIPGIGASASLDAGVERSTTRSIREADRVSSGHQSVDDFTSQNQQGDRNAAAEKQTANTQTDQGVRTGASLTANLSNSEAKAVSESVLQSESFRQDKTLREAATQTWQASEQAERAKQLQQQVQLGGQISANNLVSRLQQDPAYRQSLLDQTQDLVSHGDPHYLFWQNKMNGFAGRSYSEDQKDLVARWQALHATDQDAAFRFDARYFGVDLDTRPPTTLTPETLKNQVGQKAAEAGSLVEPKSRQDAIKSEYENLRSQSGRAIRAGDGQVRALHQAGKGDVDGQGGINLNAIPSEDRYYRDVHQGLGDVHQRLKDDPRARFLLDELTGGQKYLEGLKAKDTSPDRSASADRQREAVAERIRLQGKLYRQQLFPGELKMFNEGMGKDLDQQVARLSAERHLTGQLGKQQIDEHTKPDGKQP